MEVFLPPNALRIESMPGLELIRGKKTDMSMLVNDGENDSEHASMQAITARTKTLKEDTIGPDPPMARIGAGFLGGIC
jgi:hypothetical protein